MKVLIVALFMVGAFVKGQEESAEGNKEDLLGDFLKDMETCPCYPFFKQFIGNDADCENFKSALVTDEQFDKIKKDSLEKVGDKFKDLTGLGGSGLFDEMIKSQLCAIEKLGVIDVATKSLIEEKCIALYQVIEDTTVRNELTKALKECVAEKYDSEAKFVNEIMCFTPKFLKICTAAKQKQALGKLPNVNIGNGKKLL